jgi:hypothetical protein
LLGDGDAEESYYPLVTQIHEAGITISTVAAGGGTYGCGGALLDQGPLARQRDHSADCRGTMKSGGLTVL